MVYVRARTHTLSHNTHTHTHAQGSSSVSPELANSRAKAARAPCPDFSQVPIAPQHENAPQENDATQPGSTPAEQAAAAAVCADADVVSTEGGGDAVGARSKDFTKFGAGLRHDGPDAVKLEHPPGMRFPSKPLTAVPLEEQDNLSVSLTMCVILDIWVYKSEYVCTCIYACVAYMCICMH